MTTNGAQYCLDGTDHEYNLSNLFVELLTKNELIDVTLAADGYLFNAHRLILSAISPYFRSMFVQMPRNQYAFVFLKDVSKQTVEKIITYIYCGNVTLNESDLKDFFATAHALEIDGLTGDICLDYIDETTPSNSEPVIPATNGIQYQSTATVRTNGPVNGISNQQSQTVEFVYVDELENDGINQHFLFTNRTHKSKSTQTQSNYQKQVSRHKDPIDYTIRADIRPNARRTNHLYHKGHEFTINRIGIRKTCWHCSKKISKGCHASISTAKVNGVTMMKVLKAKHSHP